MEAGATMPGTLVNCRLEELDDRCICIDEVMDSVRALFESLIKWNLDSWATVRFVADSPRLVGSKLLRVLRLSRAFKKSEMASSSACNDPELVPPVSASKPDPGWATEDARLCRPLLFCSSSPARPMDIRPRLCVKLLLYRPVDAGLGEPTVGVSTDVEGGPPRREAGIPAVNELLLRGCELMGKFTGRLCEYADEGDSGSSCRGTGDPESDPALKG